mmetsp:Transcript_22952/g.58868  ORF Transcript_22952/g.58868 Transcript_22952/m.58868 type:complete len:221 (-) Transcript_22952:596-1258(-)
MKHDLQHPVLRVGVGKMRQPRHMQREGVRQPAQGHRCVAAPLGGAEEEGLARGDGEEAGPVADVHVVPGVEAGPTAVADSVRPVRRLPRRRHPNPSPSHLRQRLRGRPWRADAGVGAGHPPDCGRRGIRAGAGRPHQFHPLGVELIQSPPLDFQRKLSLVGHNLRREVHHHWVHEASPPSCRLSDCGHPHGLEAIHEGGIEQVAGMVIGSVCEGTIRKTP